MKVKQESEKVGLKLTFKKLRSWHPVPLLHGKYILLSGNNGNSEKLYYFFFFWWGGAPTSLQMVIAAMKLKDTYCLKGKL